MAVLAYPIEHYAHWRGLGLQLPVAGAMAENFTVSGLVEDDVNIGDVFEVGSAAVQVCQPRSPCYKLSARFGRKDMSILVQDTGFAGYKLRVLVEGEVGAGDAMVLIDRDSNHSVSVAEAGRIVSVDRNDLEGARRLLRIGSLGFTVRNTLEARVAANAHLGPDTDRLHLPDDVGHA
jgi:MOSC domain-containing protein YiiM